MFTLYTKKMAILFSNKKQALDFYTRGFYECDGAEKERYANCVNAIIAGNGLNTCMDDFEGLNNLTQTYMYEAESDHLVKVQIKSK